MKQRSKTIVRKPTLYILITVLAVMLVTISFSFWTCYQAAKAENHIRYVGMMKVVAEKVAKTIRSMEMNANNVFDEVGEHLDSPESVIQALEERAKLNKEVRGYFAAFEPYYYKEKGEWFEPYVHQPDTTGSFVVRDVGSARHNYTKSRWYICAKGLISEKKPGDDLSEISFWSKPYYYYDGTSISGHYCTYVRPVFDNSGKLACVCGADMTFEWLSKAIAYTDRESRQDKLLNMYRMFRDFDFYTVILNNDGSCIAYPDGKRLPIIDKDVISDLEQKKTGMVRMVINDVPSLVYYGPIQNIDWSVAVVVPLQGIYKPLVMLGIALLILTTIGMIIIWFVCRRTRYVETT